MASEVALERRRQILDAAVRVFAREGFHATRVSDIADEAGALATVELMRPVLPANLLGLPAAVVSAGFAGGLPAGVQVIGARYTDLRCIAIAEQIESACAIRTPIDPID